MKIAGKPRQYCVLDFGLTLNSTWFCNRNKLITASVLSWFSLLAKCSRIDWAWIAPLQRYA